jgi:hypothetical protein
MVFLTASILKVLKENFVFQEHAWPFFSGLYKRRCCFPEAGSQKNELRLSYKIELRVKLGRSVIETFYHLAQTSSTKIYNYTSTNIL